MKRVYIQTFGCQMNERDSEVMAGLLQGEGYCLTRRIDQADLIIFNTCSVRDLAEQKLYSALGRTKDYKQGNRRVLVGVAGCIAQQEGSRLLKRAPQVDLVIGTSNLRRLPALVEEVSRSGCRTVETERDPGYPHYDLPSVRATGVRAWVNIMYGCDKACTFCIVPHVRGEERSRPMEAIVEEVRGLAGQGCREVTLLGQNVNSYGKREPRTTEFCHSSVVRGEYSRESFARLLKLLNDTPGIARIRFTTAHPMDLSPGLIGAMADLPKLCEHLHLPIQSGSDRILRAMGRGYTYAGYLRKTRLLRERVPGVAISTDVIVGFPGETDEDFTRTLEALREIRFHSLFAFKYSPRPFTPAAAMSDQVPEAVKEERLQRVLQLQETIARCLYEGYVGKFLEILVEEADPANGELTGRTRGNLLVHFPGRADLIGSLQRIVITQALGHSLRGKGVHGRQ
ncbi:MAG: tRNA (N6-isopentenyl adenosine(37)-C2)-methylthiotransferase MiaB [Nitrospirae bacterium]|nr:tRNA (N6-isopentenyl adenosine(37)-C2)-methylthiotransferase MiaB [Nitrospirota bacterium]